MIKRTKKGFQNIINSGQAGGALLILCVIISLIIANTGANQPFKNLLAIELGFETSAIHLKYSLLNWINDGLMAIFFFLIGIEIKQESIYGHLSKSLVSIGSLVASGTSIAISGKTGRVTGHHLHFGLKHNGGFIDPLKMLYLFDKLEGNELYLFLNDLIEVRNLFGPTTKVEGKTDINH